MSSDFIGSHCEYRFLLYHPCHVVGKNYPELVTDVIILNESAAVHAADTIKNALLQLGGWEVLRTFTFLPASVHVTTV